MEWICHFLCLVLLNELCIIIILFGLNLKLQFCAKASFSLLLILLAYHGEEEGGVFARYVPGHGPVHREHVGHVEPDTGQEVASRVHHEDRVLEQAEVHHLEEDGGFLRFEAATGDFRLSLWDPSQRGLFAVYHRPSVFVWVFSAKL